MSISLTPFVSGSACHGYTWSIDNIDELAAHIAQVAVGQAEHVSEILVGAGVGPSAADSWAASGALELLTAAVSDPFHRDGWMFQVMSWIAAHRGSPGAIIRAPHMIKAHKGFDGLQVDIGDQGGAVSAVVIFEDKATENPRRVIRTDIWPDFRALERGKDQNVLVAEVTTLLKAAGQSGAMATMKDIVWGKAKRYRVSITVSQTHADTAGRARLFSGFDSVAPGDINRRQVETVTIPNLRPWLHDLAELAKSKIQSLVTTNV